MAMVGDFVVGKAFEALYAGVEDLIRKNVIFKSLFVDLKSRLDCLAPLIEEMAKYNQQLDRTKKELEALEELMKGGIELVGKCSQLRVWNVYKKYKYASKFLEFKESLQNQLDVLKVQVARDVKKTEVAVENMQAAVQNIQVVVNRLDLVQQNQSSSEIKGLSEVLPELPTLTVGLEVPLEELKAELLLKDEVPMLVVTAPGGCGKTTLATKFCQDQQVKDKFKNNIFFVTFSKKPNLQLIMKELYKQKGYEVPTFQNEVNPVKWLQKIQKEKGDDPLLLVLDDVWSGSESLLEKFEFKMSNYKIFVTSRSEFPRFGSSYHLQLLDNDNAMKLFHHTASLGDKSSHIPTEVSKKIVKHCNGFPLAITVAGRSLCGQPLAMWQSRVIEWSKGSSILDFETELLLRLQSSLDALDNEMPMVKSCYLDLGVFPEDTRIQVSALIDMWAELYDLDEETVCIAKLHELSNRSLANFFHSSMKKVVEVPEDTHYSELVVTQHDLLRELAIYESKRAPIELRERLIIEICGNNLPKWWREEKNQPIKARLVSISTDGDFSLVKWPNMQLPEAEVLVLNFQNEHNYALPEFVQKMDMLKMLVLINSSVYYNNVDNFQLLDSLSNLTSIRLDGFNFSCITESPVQLKNLHKLYLRCGKSLGNGPVKLSHVFPNLKEIIIDFYRWKEFPTEIFELIHLTKLIITCCSVFTELSVLPEAIGNLVNLEVLRLRHYSKLSEVPDSIRNLHKLKFLEIHFCPKFEKLTEHIGELKCLRNLIIHSCDSLSALPEAIGNLVNLQVLSLRCCEGLSELPESIRNLRKLNFLDIYCCTKIKELPEHIGELENLRKLDMTCCCRLKKMPQSVLDLQQLEEVLCDAWHAKRFWEPLLPNLKNLRIMVWKENSS